jgi:hypothetical protein
VAGIRLRAENGSKFAKTGSHQGLFIPDGEIPDQLTDLAVTEGPTDCAAMLDLGMWALGRPACRGMEAEITEICRGRRVVVLSDYDEAKIRPDGTKWYPGQEGAAALCAAIKGKARSLKLVFPLRGKDARAWLAAGATPDILRVVIANSAEWKK